MSLTGSAITAPQFEQRDPDSQAPGTQIVADERHKISRDIHDSAVQPYIGLKFALEALARKIPPDHPLHTEVGRLVAMTSMEIAGLRRYIKGLKGELPPAQETLGSVMRRHAARYAELYGIRVSLELDGKAGVDVGLGDDLAHILGAALSNVRRHTNATYARVSLVCDPRKVTLKIVNPSDHGTAPNAFTPGSITERALALGGHCKIETGRGRTRNTAVTVEIPRRF
jgi:signal transduction histidine kinase